MSARAIFVGGTASHAGKSWMTTAICRHLRRRGLRVAPFKAQNMSNNSYPCKAGGEIGRAQVAQAEACGLEPEPDMNPVLLKPASSSGCQVVVNGRVWRQLSARDYYEHFDYLLQQVLDAYSRLARRFEYIVMEGAGSLCEINLKSRDLVNLGLARRVEAPALLVADIDRGGVFASLVGTFCLLEPEERDLVRSFAINRFRGDLALFSDGAAWLENRTGKPCLGVFPFAEGIELDAEDSVSLEDRSPARSRVAIVRLPHISNFTDFRLLPHAAWIDRPVDRNFDVVLLPGTKNTRGDLAWLRDRHLDQWLVDQFRQGAHIVGVCGGYQMMGERIEDPDGVEGDPGGSNGLHLLPLHTRLVREKITRAVEALTPDGHRFRAYEIHMGRTEALHSLPPFATLADGSQDGVRAGRLTGTYLHGALEDPVVLGQLLGECVPAPAPKERHYEALASWFEQHADLRRFEELYL